MVFKWLFYTTKPMIPRRVQIALRRRVARYIRQKNCHLWPIDPDSAHPPEGWKGWPDGRQFALVLSHDVDTFHGYKDVLKVVELEEKMGFRSCFSFVPERYGSISLDLLEELRGRGFDVAVHGLKHDGKLFLSKRMFDVQAPRINGYLKRWKTEGFTSPSMQRNLEWMTSLSINYCTSTFDTDPFEPEPDGVGTIFPFAVFKGSSEQKAVSSKQSGSQTPAPSTQNPDPGYSFQNPEPSSENPEPKFFIELPYTLPQDSTLFLILREKSIDIWRDKLDWIAEKGGMALLNTHPDYMACNDVGGRWEEYSISLYKGFLEYAKDRYGGRYWHVLPKQMARFWREKMVLTKNEKADKLGG
jgi:hypothetical protein